MCKADETQHSQLIHATRSVGCHASSSVERLPVPGVLEAVLALQIRSAGHALGRTLATKRLKDLLRLVSSDQSKDYTRHTVELFGIVGIGANDESRAAASGTDVAIVCAMYAPAP